MPERSFPQRVCVAENQSIPLLSNAEFRDEQVYLSEHTAMNVCRDSDSSYVDTESTCLQAEGSITASGTCCREGSEDIFIKDAKPTGFWKLLSLFLFFPRKNLIIFVLMSALCAGYQALVSTTMASTIGTFYKSAPIVYV